MSKNDEGKKYRSLFLSDFHLGTRGCQAQLLLDFLRDYDAETIYLVGDIVDAWQLKSTWYWPQAHNDVVQKLLRKARKGSRLIYIPGNHDEFLRDFPGHHFGGIEVVEQTVHVAADGKRYVVMHGDAFDVVVRHAKWLAHLGDWAYVFALGLNTERYQPRAYDARPITHGLSPRADRARGKTRSIHGATPRAASVPPP